MQEEDANTTQTGTEDMVCFVSIDPRSGFLSSYPEWVQTKLRRHNERLAVPTDVFLGPYFHNATVHLRADGRHYQTTPPAAGVARSGKRTVAAVQLGAPVWVWCRDRYWTLHPDNSNVQTRQTRQTRLTRLTRQTGAITSDAQCRAAPEIPMHPIWEWCQLPLVRGLWRAYNADASEALELAFRRMIDRGESQTVRVSIGPCVKEVHVRLNEPLHIQTDVASGRKRWVRRRYSTRTEAEMFERAAREVALKHGDASCAICLEEFAETPLWPVLRTACGHTFHGACIHPLLLRSDPCPLCRGVIRDAGFAAV